MKRKLMTWTLICSVLLLMLPVHAEAASEKVTLKVLAYTQEDFNKNFGDAFTAKYPNIQFKVIPTQKHKNLDEIRKLEDKEKPDLLSSESLSAYNLDKYVAEGKLVDLDPYIAQSKSIKLANLNQNIVNSMKVNGKLYTLSPTFMVKGLFYNKTLFDKYKIKYPKNEMSWAEVMKLAAEFKQKAGSPGFQYNNDLFSLAASDIAGSYNLRFQDKNKGGKNITINTKEWKSIFDMVVKAAKKEAITTKNKAFLAGDAAMTVGGPLFFVGFKMEKIKFEWGVVSEPVNPAHPISSAYGANNMFGISTESKHADAAWKFIEFVNSDDFAKGYMKDGELGSGLPTNECCKKWDNKVDLSGLYRLAPVKEKYDPNIPDISEFVSKEGSAAFTSVLKGTQSLDSMLDSLQKKAQSELDKAWAKKGK
ncbi:extracellular solute-binding protein [Paenibacillus thiaminolyticus]|uniref:Extracellular solute-binding protein n=2 Tax=Paenibacillus thiaminolyticus TaxID=49283 RepID=A0ABT4G0K3_PANTH|nr:extracellular solute-binding protein [Paenibacillus thiaminolyticus]MCY9534930.1 extracellular solute-binding protein [Paenibacillus thiaminolyticus]MCY9604292.1 extracellular solute-binding protein [Paenibacillus thiaminolyticus]MCY9609610.1 extracellular solute-binding protein [Paenibacillus thiaminolyticus]MCY9612440.1 extracellular solute-binding protein [Paenibacillus thiaminolyticus]MCY9617421.1 extracellular solute-binding protein [Paenibacillus thiaminolyticus]